MEIKKTVIAIVPFQMIHAKTGQVMDGETQHCIPSEKHLAIIAGLSWRERRLFKKNLDPKIITREKKGLIEVNYPLNPLVIIDDFTHIGPGVHLAGVVSVGSGSFVGIGASVIELIKIGSNSIIGAGAAVVDDVPDNVTVVGVPARILKRTDSHEYSHCTRAD